MSPLDSREPDWGPPFASRVRGLAAGLFATMAAESACPRCGPRRSLQPGAHGSLAGFALALTALLPQQQVQWF